MKALRGCRNTKIVTAEPTAEKYRNWNVSVKEGQIYLYLSRQMRILYGRKEHQALLEASIMQQNGADLSGLRKIRMPQM